MLSLGVYNIFEKLVGDVDTSVGRKQHRIYRGYIKVLGKRNRKTKKKYKYIVANVDIKKIVPKCREGWLCNALLQ